MLLKGCCWGTTFTSDARETHNDILPLNNMMSVLGKKKATGKEEKKKKGKNGALYLNVAWPIASSWSNATRSTFCPGRQKNNMKVSEEYICKKSPHGRLYKSPSHQAYHPHTVSWNSKITKMHFFSTKARWALLVLFSAMVYILSWMRHAPWMITVQFFRVMFQLNNRSRAFSPLSTSKQSRCPYQNQPEGSGQFSIGTHSISPAVYMHIC